MKKILFIFALGIIAGIICAAATKPAHAAELTCDASNDLSGSISINLESQTATGMIHNSSPSCSYKVGMATYQEFNDEDPDTQKLIQFKTDKIGPASDIIFTVQLAVCKTQVDLFWGDVITQFKGDLRYNNRLLAVVHTVKPLCGTGKSVTPAGGSDTFNAVPPHTVPEVIPTPVPTKGNKGGKDVSTSTDTGAGHVIPGLPNTGEGGFDLSNPDNASEATIGVIILFLLCIIIIGGVKSRL